eukprot:Clim_evm4s5 gene=Clim_evmTU4s5
MAGEPTRRPLRRLRPVVNDDTDSSTSSTSTNEERPMLRGRGVSPNPMVSDREFTPEDYRYAAEEAQWQHRLGRPWRILGTQSRFGRSHMSVHAPDPIRDSPRRVMVQRQGSDQYTEGASNPVSPLFREVASSPGMELNRPDTLQLPSQTDAYALPRQRSQTSPQRTRKRAHFRHGSFNGSASMTEGSTSALTVNGYDIYGHTNGTDSDNRAQGATRQQTGKVLRGIRRAFGRCKPKAHTKVAYRDRMSISPWEKWSTYGKFPYKMVLNMLLTFLLTMRLVMETSQFQSYIAAQHQTFRNVFTPNAGRGAMPMYTIGDVLDHIRDDVTKYFSLRENSVDHYSLFDLEGNPYPVVMTLKLFASSEDGPITVPPAEPPLQGSVGPPIPSNSTTTPPSTSAGAPWQTQSASTRTETSATSSTTLQPTSDTYSAGNVIDLHSLPVKSVKVDSTAGPAFDEAAHIRRERRRRREERLLKIYDEKMGRDPDVDNVAMEKEDLINATLLQEVNDKADMSSSWWTYDSISNFFQEDRRERRRGAPVYKKYPLGPAHPAGPFEDMDVEALRYIFDSLYGIEIDFRLRNENSGPLMAEAEFEWHVVTEYDLDSGGGQAFYILQIEKTLVHRSSDLFLYFDGLIGCLSVWSIFLVLRAIYNSYQTYKYAQRMLSKARSPNGLYWPELDWDDRLAFFKVWYVISFFADSCAVCASIWNIELSMGKLSNATQTADFGDIMQATALFMNWINLIRYFEWATEYYTLILAVRSSFFRTCRFIAATMPIFMAYAAAGVALFNGVGDDFGSLTDSSITLFALLHGDSILEVFRNLADVEGDPFQVWLGRTFLLTFCTFFITMVLNVFIFIVEDGYQMAKDAEFGGLPPPWEIEGITIDNIRLRQILSEAEAVEDGLEWLEEEGSDDDGESQEGELGADGGTDGNGNDPPGGDRVLSREESNASRASHSRSSQSDAGPEGREARQSATSLDPFEEETDEQLLQFQKPTLLKSTSDDLVPLDGSTGSVGKAVRPEGRNSFLVGSPPSNEETLQAPSTVSGATASPYSVPSEEMLKNGTELTPRTRSALAEAGEALPSRQLFEPYRPSSRPAPFKRNRTTSSGKDEADKPMFSPPGSCDHVDREARTALFLKKSPKEPPVDAHDNAGSATTSVGGHVSDFRSVKVPPSKDHRPSAPSGHGTNSSHSSSTGIASGPVSALMERQEAYIEAIQSTRQPRLGSIGFIRRNPRSLVNIADSQGPSRDISPAGGHRRRPSEAQGRRSSQGIEQSLDDMMSRYMQDMQSLQQRFLQDMQNLRRDVHSEVSSQGTRHSDSTSALPSHGL